VICVIETIEGVQVLSGGDHDSDLLDSLGELLRLDCSVVVQVEVLEALHEDRLFALDAACFLRKFFK